MIDYHGGLRVSSAAGWRGSSRCRHLQVAETEMGHGHEWRNSGRDAEDFLSWFTMVYYGYYDLVMV